MPLILRLRRQLRPPAALLVMAVALAAGVGPGCGRTALFPEARKASTSDGAVATPASTDGAPSLPQTNGRCPAGFTACGRGGAGRCYDLKRSPEHCGECGNACAPGIQCQAAQCQQYRCQGTLTFRALPVVSTLPTGDLPDSAFSPSLANYTPVLGDFDRDGILDFVGQTGAIAPMGLLLGNGDGTFRPQAIASAFA